VILSPRTRASTRTSSRTRAGARRSQYDRRVTAWDRDALTALRAAVVQRDVVAIRAALEGRDLDAVLQLAGDGLLAFPDDSLAYAREARLRRRGVEGRL
jgi:hypothetical protein